MQTKLDLYHRAVPLAQLGIWERNLVTGKLYWNDIVRDIYEVDVDLMPSAEGESMFYLDSAAVQQLLNEVFESRTPKTGKFRLRATSGTVKWVRLKANVHIEEGVCVALYGTIEDITEEVIMLNTLLEREQRFEQAFDFAPIGMAMVSLEGNWLKVNDSLCQLLEYSENELLKFTFQDLTHPDDLDSDLQQMYRLLAGKIRRYSIEKRYIRKNGQLIWALLHVSLVRDHQNTPLYFISQVKDISERKKHLEVVQRERLRLDNIIRSTGVGTWEWDVRSNQVIYDARSLAILGYSSDELGNSQMTTWYGLIHPEDRQANELLLQQCLQQKVDFYASECRMLHKDERWIWIEIRGKIIEWTEENQPLLMLGTYLDIHERKSLEEEQRKMLEIVSEQNSRLLNFTHIVSHNLRSHAGNIQMLADILTHEQDEQGRKEYTTMLLTNTVNLQETLVHLNEVIKVQGSDLKNKKPLKLLNEIENTLTVLSESIRHAQAQLYIEVSKQIEVRYDPAYLESILLNLISNCIKYRHPDRLLIINITAFYSEGSVLLKVTDNGLGIDLKMHGHKLFGMYKTFHGNTDARGVGLFLTKSHVEAMNGRISVESTVNVGTTFTITIKS
ncbi:sensor histidine kinase [Spirosoma sp.]|uniref:sensor histidine kinase n=1 Tax=Spirosoma sp. TaxID=1899569 RepID=UPI002606580E|nr:sensor histidine kinase [Spirosoma sp.]MCX6218633.1 PAS domain S-box protein [Spirosoma sp.]